MLTTFWMYCIADCLLSMRCTTTNLGSSPPVQLVFSVGPWGRRSTPAASSESDCCPRSCLHPDRPPPGAKHMHVSYIFSTEMVPVLVLGCFSVLFTSRVISDRVHKLVKALLYYIIQQIVPDRNQQRKIQAWANECFRVKHTFSPGLYSPVHEVQTTICSTPSTLDASAAQKLWR